MYFSFNVPRMYDGSRLDVCVSSYVNSCSRSYSASLAHNGFIRVGGIIKKPSYRVSRGDLITGCVRRVKFQTPRAESIPIKIIYEDSSILVINKDAGIVVHPSPGHSSGTLVNAIMYRCPDLKAISGTIRPGIVHRLDKDTTGLIVVAKNTEALLDMSYQFKNRKVDKRYLALVYGVPNKNQGRINFEIGRHQFDRKKMSIRSKRPRSAETIWKVIAEYGEIASLLELNLKTGRTHQIRVHCQAIGHPILGDLTYKSRGHKNHLLKNRREIVQLINNTKRQMLHAYKIKLRHPKSKKELIFKVEPPDDMGKLLKVFNNY